MRLLIVDDHPMVRKGLLSTLSFEDSVEEIKEASNIEDALMTIIEYKPDVAIIDLRLGKEDGLDIIERVKKEKLDIKCIVLTSSMQKDDFERAQELGVDGYILKEAFAEDILYAFHVVSRGKKYIDPDIFQFQDDTESIECIHELTQREKDVLKALSNGLSNIEIGEKLFISEHTVKKHVSNILMKLGLTHRTQAALVGQKVSNL